MNFLWPTSFLSTPRSSPTERDKSWPILVFQEGKTIFRSSLHITKTERQLLHPPPLATGTSSSVCQENTLVNKLVISSVHLLLNPKSNNHFHDTHQTEEKSKGSACHKQNERISFKDSQDVFLELVEMYYLIEVFFIAAL